MTTLKGDDPLAEMEAEVAALRSSPEIAALVAEVERLQAALVEKGRELLFLEAAGVLEPSDRVILGDQPQQVGLGALIRLRQPATTWPEWPRGFISGHWWSAIPPLARERALMRNANGG